MYLAQCDSHPQNLECVCIFICPYPFLATCILTAVCGWITCVVLSFYACVREKERDDRWCDWDQASHLHVVFSRTKRLSCVLKKREGWSARNRCISCFNRCCDLQHSATKTHQDEMEEEWIEKMSSLLFMLFCVCIFMEGMTYNVQSNDWKWISLNKLMHSRDDDTKAYQQYF